MNTYPHDLGTRMVEASRKRMYQQTNIDRSMFPRDNVKVQYFEVLENFADSSGIRFTLDLLGNKVGTHTLTTFSYPKDWWAAFKERWFPKWAKRRWPAVFHTVNTLEEHWHICPHMAVPQQDPPHVMWLMRDEPR